MSLPARSEYTSGAYAEGNVGWHEADARWKAQQVQRILAANHVHPQRVCDLGCGTGGVLDELGVLDPAITELVGYEVAEEATRMAPRQRSERVQFCLGEPPAAAHFDLALMMDVFEHVEDFYGLLRRHHRLADHFVFHIPLDISVANVLREDRFDRLRRAVGHIHYFTRESALASLSDAGYRIIDCFFTAPGIDRPESRLQRVVRPARWLLFRISPSMAARVLGGFSLCVLAS